MQEIEVDRRSYEPDEIEVYTFIKDLHGNEIGERSKSCTSL